MVARHSRTLLCCLTAMAFVTLVCAAAPSARAGELDKLDTSLKLIPEDAAFYSCSLRLREQVEIVKNSKAWAKVCDMPIVQMGFNLYAMQQAVPDSGPAKIAEALKNPEVRKIVDLVGEMVSDEIFLYGDESFVGAVDLFQKVNAANSYAPLLAVLAGSPEELQNGHAQGKAVIAALAENLELIGIPGLVVGFKLKNGDLAKEQLIKLETIANIFLEMSEQTKGRFKKQKVGDHEYLVLELDGAMIPWNAMPLERFKEMEPNEGDVEKIVDHLKESKLVLALGLRGNYLVAAIGSSLEPLEKLGKGSRLIDSDAFKPLEKYVDKRLASLAYVSEEMSQQVNNYQQSVDNIVQLVNDALPSSKLSDTQKEKIRKDAQAWSKDMKSVMPETGAFMGLSFLTDRGLEAYQYAWGDHGRIDGSKPLGLIQHLGGNPIFAVVARQNLSLKDYDIVARWVKTGYGYFEEFGLPAMDEEEREKAKKFFALAMPLLRRFDTANREMFIPAMADGQLALVLDAKLMGDRYLESLPATKTPMPMAEPALVFGISDAKLLQKAFGEYRAIINGLIDAGRQVDGGDMPTDLKLPEPMVTKDPLGTIYSYALPEDWGVDKRIVLNVGLAEKVAVISLSHDHTKRLLQKTPPAAGGVLSQLDRPLACAAWFDWATLLDKASPWADFAVEQLAASNNQDEEHQKAISGQVHTAIEVLKCLKAVTSEVFLEEDVLVQHSLLEIHDLAK